MKKTSYWLGLLALLKLSAAEAINQEIRALFQPDSSQPNRNVFVNKTPNSGYCTIDPAQCTDNNMFSIQLPVRFSSTRPIYPGLPGDGLSLKVPANWRQLTVTHHETGESEIVEVRIIGIGSNFFLSDSAANLVGVTDILEGHQKLWTSSSWVYAPSPCLYSGVGWYSPNSYRFFWKAPVEASCTKAAAYRIPSMYFDTLDFAYELRTPNPLGMSSGLYTGSLSYTLGPNGDFQMGPMMVPDDSNLTLDFVLDVQHTLKVELPPGGNRVTLEPEGGWQRWLDSGQKPEKVYRDQPFYISASTRFRVWMECAEGAPGGMTDDACNMKSLKTGRRVLFRPKLSLPSGIRDNIGREVRHQPIFHQRPWIVYTPGHYVDRKQGSLRFEINRTDIGNLLQPGVSDDFVGFVTVIWDSDI